MVRKDMIGKVSEFFGTVKADILPAVR